MNLHALPAGDKYPEYFNALIEIPKGTHNKYEFDEDLGIMKLDRVLYSPLFYPVDYGFIPQTHADDGDPLDAMVLTESPVFPGCLVECRPVALLKMSDEEGVDDKVLCVAKKNPRYSTINDLEDVDPHTLKEIAHFFSTYKLLENKEVKIDGWFNKTEALKIMQAALEAGKSHQ